MGWFLVNIVLPVAVPAAFMLLARMANLPRDAAVRTSLLLLVQDGQLGWIALTFASSCVYEVFSYMMSGPGLSPIEAWLPTIAALAIALIAASGYMAALGVLYPAQGLSSMHPLRQRNGLFVATSMFTCAAAALQSVVHFYLH